MLIHVNQFGSNDELESFYKSKYCVLAPIKIHKDYLLYVIAFYIASYKKLEVNESESFSTL